MPTPRTPTVLYAEIAAQLASAQPGGIVAQQLRTVLNDVVASTTGDIINVKWFGAIGDGVTDDTAAIQAAVNVAALLGIVLFPPGTYKITDTINVIFTSNWQALNMRGSGNASKIDWRGGNTKPMIHYRGTGGAGFYSKSFVEKLYLYGNAFTPDGDPYTDITGIKIGNTPEDVNSGVCNFTVRDCLIANITIGVGGYYESDEVTIENTYIERYTGYGILNSHGGSGWQIVKNHLSGGGVLSVGIYSSLSSTRIQGNVIQSVQFSIGIQGVGGAAFGGKTFHVSDNYIESQLGAAYGILMLGVDTGLLVNNTFNGLAGATLIYLGDQSGVSCTNISIGVNRHTQSGGFIANLVFATSGCTKCAIMGPQTTDGAVTTITGPFEYKFTDGNVEIATAKGVTMLIAGTRAGVQSTTLVGYEHGLFTPTITFGGAATGVTYALQQAYYTRIGNRVFVNGTIALTSKGSSTGSARITGLPFTSLSTAFMQSVLSLNLRNVTFVGQFQSIVPDNVTTATLQEMSEAGSATDLTDADFANNSEVAFAGSYPCA